MRFGFSASFAVAAGLLAGMGCGEELDTTRRAPPRGSLGQEVYGVVCDRLGAALFTEDLSGASYAKVCHPDAQGRFSDRVDASKLPDPAGFGDPARRLAATAARAASIAKMEALARRRSDLIQALDATFDDEPLADPHGGDTVNGHEALSRMLKALVPLYEQNPIDPSSGAPLLPSATRATGQLLAALGGPGADAFTGAVDSVRSLAAREALARFSGRQGHRPPRLTLGVLKPALAYPGLRSLVQAMGPRLAPGGNLREPFQDFLGNTEEELRTSEQRSLPPPVMVDEARAQPSRPRGRAEVAAFALLTTHPSFATAGTPARLLSRRELRGWAVPRGSIPGVPGTLPTPFADLDGDGLADVDALGRFVGADRGPARVDPPFLVPGWARVGAADALGRALGADGLPLYETLDTSTTLLTGLVRDFLPRVNPDAGDETLVDLLAGAQLLLGERVEREASWAAGGSYSGFDATEAPLVDLVHAAGQMLAHRRSDVTLALVDRLLAEHEPLVARVIGAALKIREVSNRHPEARLAPENPFWEEFFEVVVQLVRKPALFKEVLRSLKDPRVHTTLAHAFGEYTRYRDVMSYDPSDLNGDPLNLTIGGGSKQPPSTPPDRSRPDAVLPGGVDNRSAFHRVLQMIHDMNGVNACNRAGAKVRVRLGPLDLAWPLIGSYGECEVLRIEDIGIVYLDSVLDDVYRRNPRQGRLVIQDDVLNGLTNLLGAIGSVDQLFEQSSGIRGLSLTPTARAFHRLVFFGTTSAKYDAFFGGAMPDRDPYATSGRNALTNEFISSLIDPLSTSVCPTRFVGNFELADCGHRFADGTPGSPQDLLRVRDRGGIFLWELYDFLAGIAPLAKPFDDSGDVQLFLDLVDTLYRHWPSEAHGSECSRAGTWRRGAPGFNPRYCHESGLSRYEPILDEVFFGDFLPALAELITVLDRPGFVTDVRGSGEALNGVDLLHEVAVAFLDPEYASGVGMKDRQGRSTTRWVDGSREKPQLAPVDLFASALRAIDERLEGRPELARWRSARSNVVDTFLTVDGSGAAARFRNAAFVPGARALLRALREQLNANCPDRERTGRCPWGEREMASKLTETLEGPTFGTVMELLRLADGEPEVRLELQRFLRHLLGQAALADGETIASAADMLQLLSDDVNLPPLYNAVSLAAARNDGTLGGKPAPGTVDRVLELVNALTREVDGAGNAAPNPFDRYRVLDRILRNLVTPMDPADAQSRAPLEILLDVIAEVNREDASLPPEAPLSARDFELVFGTLRDFFVGDRRGLEQFYEIIRHRDGK